MPRKDAQIADALADLVSAVDANEEATQSVGRDVDLDVVDVKSGPGAFERRLVDVRCENLDRHLLRSRGQEFQQADRQRIDFLAAGAAGDPDPNRSILRSTREKRRKDLLLQHLERFRLPKELRDADQQILEQILELGRVAAQQCDVGIDVIDVPKSHAALDPSLDRRPLVMAEVDFLAGPQKVDDLLDGVSAVERIGRRRRRLLRVGMLRQTDQVSCDLLRRQHMIDASVHNGAAGHAFVLGGRFLLGERDAPFRLDRLKAERPVRTAPRQDHADRLGALHLRQRPEQVIGRHVRNVRHPRRQPQMAVGQSQRLIGRMM